MSSENVTASEAGNPPRLRAGQRITLEEIRRAYEPLSEKVPPLLLLDQAAEVARITPGTLKRKVSEGEFAASVCRGKPLRLWRGRFVYQLINERR